MLIEVITPESATNKDKGDLLENLASEFLQTQGYKVETEVRVTASELDLLCKHNVNSKKVYVECKAHTNNLSAEVLTKLLGTIELHEYSEGWLISTGPLGKDAKGFVEKWENKKDPAKKEKLSIYTPERILDALLHAHLICEQPKQIANSMIADGMTIGEWTLLISPWDKYWAVPLLNNGVPSFVAFFSTKDGKYISDKTLLQNIRQTNFHLKELEIYKTGKGFPSKDNGVALPAVVEVEIGEEWCDYRPARPEHFVGRKEAQKNILRYFSDVKQKRTDTRVFAIKGDSGIGKSSLVAKIREVAKTSQKPSNLFLYAVDMRAANNSNYIFAALLNALRQASQNGFGTNIDLEITNYQDPLQSQSIKDFLDECTKKKELIILVFDQFEELYSKPELFSVFEEAKRLMFSAISASTNLVLGFAWKSDSTIPQDHPAYYMWHQLTDHRYEIPLRPFSRSDAEHTMKLFESELGETLLPELQRYLIESSQGFPWLLKKLCIHFYDQIKLGSNQRQLANRSLDISSLFDQDMNSLTEAETGCLKLVAQNAPMDWYEVLGNTQHDVVQSLQDKRLLIRRGNKLNLYWDIFRDYVLSGTIPSIPFTYMPQSPSLGSLLKITQLLDDAEGKSLADLANGAELKPSTVGNILHDLGQFGLIDQNDDGIILSPHLEDSDPKTILSNIRLLFRRHALTEKLKTHSVSMPADIELIVSYQKDISPTAKHQNRTWETYAKRIITWLEALGLAQRNKDNGVFYHDIGDVSIGNQKQWSRTHKRTLFFGDTSPAKVVEALDILREETKTMNSMKNLGYNNACAVLCRFKLVELTSEQSYRVSEEVLDNLSVDLIWREADKEHTVSLTKEILIQANNISPEEIGKQIAEKLSSKWKQSTCLRVGRALHQWTTWLMTPVASNGGKPLPPGRKKKTVDNHPSLFDWNHESE